jgi:hypothetical protein
LCGLIFCLYPLGLCGCERCVVWTFFTVCIHNLKENWTCECSKYKDTKSKCDSYWKTM